MFRAYEKRTERPVPEGAALPHPKSGTPLAFHTWTLMSEAPLLTPSSSVTSPTTRELNPTMSPPTGELMMNWGLSEFWSMESCCRTFCRPGSSAASRSWYAVMSPASSCAILSTVTCLFALAAKTAGYRYWWELVLPALSSTMISNQKVPDVAVSALETKL